MTDLVSNERPLVIQRAEVKHFGAVAAIALNHLAYWAGREVRTYDGYRWISATYAEWGAEVGLTAKATRGAADRLRNEGVVVAIQNPLESLDRTLWWRVDYGRLNMIFNRAVRP